MKKFNIQNVKNSNAHVIFDKIKTKDEIGEKNKN
jgi:hypothetical protein